MRMFVTNDRRRRVQIAPSAQSCAAQNAAHRGRADAHPARHLIAGHVFTAQGNYLFPKRFWQPPRRTMRSRTAVQQTLQTCLSITTNPLADRLQAHPKSPSAALCVFLDEQQIGPEILDFDSSIRHSYECPFNPSEDFSCSSQPAHPKMFEWTAS